MSSITTSEFYKDFVDSEFSEYVFSHKNSTLPPSPKDITLPFGKKLFSTLLGGCAKSISDADIRETDIRTSVRTRKFKQYCSSMRLNIYGLRAMVNSGLHLEYVRVSNLLPALTQPEMIKTRTPVLKRLVSQYYGV